MTTRFMISWATALLFIIALNAEAQTKKIAWRSHGGSNMTFTFELPDDFGIADPSFYGKLKEKQLADSTTMLDSLAVCTPAGSAELPPPPKSKTQQKKEKRQQKRAIRQQYKQEVKALKIEKKEALKEVTSHASVSSQMAVVTPPQEATAWLWLLILPLAFVFGVSIKKP